jgi:hypothetical protein
MSLRRSRRALLGNLQTPVCFPIMTRLVRW